MRATAAILILFVASSSYGQLNRGFLSVASRQNRQYANTPAVASTFQLVYGIGAQNASGQTVHGMTNVASGDWLVMTTQNENDTGTVTVTDSVSGTWGTVAASSSSGNGNATILTNKPATTGTIYVTNNWGANAQSAVVYLLRNVNTAPVAYKTNAVTTGALSQAIPIATGGSIMFWVLSDFNSVSTAYTYRAAPSAIHLDYDQGTLTRGIHGYSTNVSSGTVTTGFSLPASGENSGVVCVVIKP